jgi:hypothetical protein
MFKRFFVVFFLFFTSKNVFAQISEVITVCEVKKLFAVYINTSLSQHDKTEAEYSNNLNGEIYTLSKVNPQNEKEDGWLRKTEYLNISYLSKNTGYKFSELQIFNEEKEDNNIEFLNRTEYLRRGNPIIIKTVSLLPSKVERIYFFNLDKNGSGTMTMVHTRYYTFLDIGNSQSLYYAECKL